jgi:hypothetical protein
MSKKYEENISGVKLEYNKKLYKCQDCKQLIRDKLQEIEDTIAQVSHSIKKSVLENEYNNNEEESINCECGNEITFIFNPYEIIKKYF